MSMTPRYPAEVISAITSAYYGRQGASPESARSRAQAAAGLGGAGAAGLIGGAVVANLSGKPWWIELVGIAAFSAWALGTALYIYAAAVPVSLQVDSRPANATEFVDAVIRLGIEERTRIDSRQKKANATALIALLLTGATLSALWGTPNPVTISMVE